MAEKKPSIDEKTKQKIQEIQFLEQNLQPLLMQKQAFQLELSETENALGEISGSKEDVFKIIGQIMIKTDRDNLEKDLKQKNELLNLRLKSIEKQESQISKQLEELRSEILKKIK